jgi:ATP-dependent HslUV protease ATP-binding subunit HslU
MERLVEEISFTATDRAGENLTIDPDYVRTHVGHLLDGADLSKFIL